MDKIVVLREYPRINFAVEKSIPISLAVYAKPDQTKEMGKGYVENSEYWNWKKDNRLFNVYQLIGQGGLRDILSNYEVDPSQLMLAYFEVNGLDENLEAFIQEIWERKEREVDLQRRLEMWRAENEVHQEVIRKIHTRLKTNQKWISKEKGATPGKNSEEFKTSPIQITSVELEGSVSMKVQERGEAKHFPIKIKNGFDIFIQSFTSFQVPFLSYKGIKEAYIKSYNGDMDIPFEKIKPSDLDIEEENTINAIVLADKHQGKTTLDSYVHVKIDLKKNTVAFQSKNLEQEKPIAATRLEEHMPIFIDHLREKNVFAEYYIYGLQLNLSLFLEMIMLDPILREFIYMDESSSFLSIKKKLMFRLREPNVDPNEKEVWKRYSSFLIHQEEAIKAEMKPFVNYYEDDREVRTVGLESRMPYMKILINKAESREALQMGLLLFTNFIRIFKKREQRLKEEMVPYGINFRKTITWKPKEHDRKMVNVDKEEYIKDLQGAAPHIFATNYASKVCQVHDQPVIIPPKLVEQWNASKDVRDDPYKKALPFPPPKDKEPEIFLGCAFEGSQKPYVNMKEHSLANKAEYPYLPCCTSKNMQAPNSHSLFTHYYLGEPYMNNEAITTSVIKSRKLLRKEQDGVLNPIIPTTFKISGLLGKNETLWRYGVSFSAFSAVRCLLYVKKDKKFMDYFKKKEFGMKDEDELDDYVRELLRSRRVEPGLMSQELHGMTPEEITDYMTRIDFFDTKELVRWLEEYFDLHVFVFDAPPNQDPISLEIPRHKMFHTRNYLDKECVVLFRHWGSNPEEFDYPQYELILKEDNKTKERTSIWPKQASQKFIQLAQKSQETFQVSPLLKEQTGGVEIRKNPYSIISYPQIFPNLHSQYIDENGKLRGITMKVGKGKGDFMTIYIPPAQPLNVPVEEDEYNVDIETVLSYFNEEPTFYSKEGDLITGIWYKILDIPEGIYIPIIPLSLEDFQEHVGEIEQGRPNPVFAFENSLMEEYHNLNKMRSVFLHTLEWIYNIYCSSQAGGKAGVERFMRKYVEVRPFDPNSELFNINTTLPTTQDLKVAMDYLSKHFPFVQGRKFSCVDQEMLEKIQYFLKATEERREQQKDLREGEKAVEVLSSLFTTAEDMPSYDDSQNFISLHNFKQWLFNERGSKMEIVERLDVSLSMVKNPFIYKHRKTNQLFIVQNVSLGEEERAIQNQLRYKEDGTNLGYYTPPVRSTRNGENPRETKEKVEKTIYIISPSGDLSKEKGEGTVRMIDYGENIYASLIQIV